MENHYGGQVPVDADGRYVIAGLTAAPIVRLTWTPDWRMLGFGLHQPCPANVAIASADTMRDIEVVGSGFGELRYESPTLSGVVYETTENGPRPLPHTRVVYAINNWDGFDVSDTVLDADLRPFKQACP